MNGADFNFTFINLGHYFNLIYILAWRNPEMLKEGLGGSWHNPSEFQEPAYRRGQGLVIVPMFRLKFPFGMQVYVPYKPCKHLQLIVSPSGDIST